MPKFGLKCFLGSFAFSLAAVVAVTKTYSVMSREDATPTFELDALKTKNIELFAHNEENDVLYEKVNRMISATQVPETNTLSEPQESPKENPAELATNTDTSDEAPVYYAPRSLPITDDAASSNSEAEAQTAAPDAPVAAEIDAADTSEDIPFEALFASTDADTETAELPAEPAATADTSTAAQSPADLIAGLMAGHKAAPNDQSDDDDDDTENNTKDEDDDEDAPAEPLDFDDLARAFGIPLSASAKSTGSTSASPEIDDFALAFGHPTPSNKEE